MNPKKSLSDILSEAQRAALERAWADTRAADDLQPPPPGRYRCELEGGEFFQARTGTPGFRLTFKVAEGSHAGRLITHDVWLTEKAAAIAKRDLGMIGITQVGELTRPIPVGNAVDVTVRLERDK